MPKKIDPELRARAVRMVLEHHLSFTTRARFRPCTGYKGLSRRVGVRGLGH